MAAKHRPTGETQEEGYTFVANGMEPYRVDETDAATICELEEDLYIAGPIRQMTNLILSGNVTISVYDEKDNVVEDLSRKLNRMFSTPECSLTVAARIAIYDLYLWGISIFNQVWEIEDGTLVCRNLTHLSSYSFSNQPSGINTSVCTVGRLMKGIYYDQQDKQIHYCQQQGMQTVELDPANLFIVKDPVSQHPDGMSLILPVAPLMKFLDFSWKTIYKQMYRTGAPLLFIQITQPKGERRGPNGELIPSDVNYARSILEKWGQDTSFTLRDNMTAHTIDVKEGSLAKICIEIAAETVQDYISPVGMLGKDGLLISGNSNASLKLINNHNHGWIRLLKNHLRNLPNYYLQHNGYPAEWHAEVNIPMITLEDTTAKLNQATLLASTKTGAVNEIRELVGVEGVSDNELKEMIDEWKILESDFTQGKIPSFLAEEKNTVRERAE